MALFGQKKENIKTAKKLASVKKTATPVSTRKIGDRTVSAGVLLAPRITEKATFSADKNVYVFNVADSATKRTIALAIESVYKIIPLKVSVTHVPSKKVVYRGKKGVKKGGKKAYVYVDKKDKIEII